MAFRQRGIPPIEEVAILSLQQLNEIIPMLRQIKEMKDVPLADMRAGYDGMLRGIAPAPGTVVEPVSAHGVPAVWCRIPASDPKHKILFLHGGAYLAGSALAFSGFASQIGQAAASDVLVVDYRLAPEHPFPAPIEDAVAAYRWLLKQSEPLTRIALAGDSAGGALCVSLMTALRDAQLPQPVAAVLFSPWADLSMSGDSIRTHADADPYITLESLQQSAKTYLAGFSAQNPAASPVFADLRGLPPLLIQVGSDEILLDDSTRLAERAGEAGVEVTLDIWPHMFHVFQAFAGQLDEGREAIEKAGHFLSGHWN